MQRLVGWKGLTPRPDNPRQQPVGDASVSPLPLETAAITDRPAFPAGPPDAIWCKQLGYLSTQEQFTAVANKLEELNPGYKQEKIAGWVERTGVSVFHERTDLLTDIRPLHCLADLKTLVLNGSGPGLGQLTDLTPLQGLRLYDLIIPENPKLRDLTPLRGMPLFKLNITGTAVQSLEPLADAPLEHLMMGGTQVQDLGPVRTMPKLRILDCTGCPIDSLEPLIGTPLQELDLDYRRERDAAVLKRMPKLKIINRMSAQEFGRKRDAQQ